MHSDNHYEHFDNFFKLDILKGHIFIKTEI